MDNVFVEVCVVVREPVGVVNSLFMFLTVLQENSVYVHCGTIRLCFCISLLSLTSRVGVIADGLNTCTITSADKFVNAATTN